MSAATLSKRELYTLVHELHSFHWPVEQIADFIGKSRSQAYRILENLGFKHLTYAERLLALTPRLIALGVRARKR